MDHHRVKRIERVLDEEFPIAGVLVTQHSACDLNLSRGRPIHEVIERARERPQPVDQTQAFRGDLRKDKAAIPIHCGNAVQGELRRSRSHPTSVITASGRDAAQSAIEVIDPAVIAASQCFARRAAAFADELRSLVQTTVEEHADLLVVAADHHYGVTSDARSEIVTGLRNLAFVTDIDPTALEDACELGLEDRSIDVDRAVHGVGSDTGAEVGRVLDSFHHLWYTRHTKNSKHHWWTGCYGSCLHRAFFRAEAVGHGRSKEIGFPAGTGLSAAPQRPQERQDRLEPGGD